MQNQKHLQLIILSLFLVFGFAIQSVFAVTCGTSFTDARDGQVYSTVLIGSQCWMTKNLNYAGVTYYCPNNDCNNRNTYGLLYTDSVARTVCPSGWTLPTDSEWHTLEGYLATETCSSTRMGLGCSPAGQKLKSSGWDGNNLSGFSALSAGGYIVSESVGTIGPNSFGTYAFFWTSSFYSSFPIGYELFTGSNEVRRNAYGADKYASSVRCVAGATVNGACGSANGHNYTSSDTTWGSYTQCSVGSPSTTAFPAINSSTTWTCSGVNGGSVSANCTASRTIINGTCGTANRTFADTETNWGSYAFCSLGTASPASPVFPIAGASTTWTCLGINGGTNSGTCTATRLSPPPPLNGTCGSANGHNYTSSDTTWGSYTQCSVGSPSTTAFPAINSSTTWTCSGVNGGSVSANCTASRTIINGTCGTANRTFAETEISWGSYNFCSLGTVFPVSPIFPTIGASTTWTCLGINGGTNSEICTANRSQNGVCGTAHNKIVSVEPSINLCSVGTPTTVSLVDNVWYWLCENSPGESASCYTYKTVCGTANGGSFAFNPSMNLCAYGSESEVVVGETTYEWTCTGNDTVSVSCLANRIASGCISCGGLTCTENEIENQDGKFIVYKYTGVGTCPWAVPDEVTSAELFIVAGGGGGGRGQGGSSFGGSGGAGGLLSGTLSGLSGFYSVTVGAGGSAATTTNSNGVSGGNSSFGSYVAYGGGCGARYVACNGGSGGSATYVYGNPPYGNATQTTQGTLSGYGNHGGTSSASYLVGGGGGATGIGGANNAYLSNGFTSSITGSAVTYAQGGWTCSGAGSNFLGNGGGGCDNSAGVGGSGTVIIKFRKPEGACGSANNASFINKPTTNLCNFGVASEVIGSGPWTWTCTGGGQSASCFANFGYCVSCGGLTCTEITDGPYTIYKYTGPGACTWTPPPNVNEVEYLIVAGGGGGGTSARAGGGGGAGGLLYGSSYSVSGTQTVTVGAGGGNSFNGENSVFGTLTVIGGGRGGNSTGAVGGSGGGGEYLSNAGGGNSTVGQGNNGGQGYDSRTVTYPFTGGGGGGAGTIGSNGTSASGGNGGSGFQSSITGTALYYAAGGGGGAQNSSVGTGGSGIGGVGGLGTGGDAVANTGSGGGGGGTTGSGGAGSSGTVILKFIMLMDGQCGTANNHNFLSTDIDWGSYTLCSKGILNPSSLNFPTAGSSVEWICDGVAGGISSGVCSATRSQDGQCGTANRTFADTETNWGSYTFCSLGTASPVSPIFPIAGNSTTWTCSGVNGGNSVSCSASVEESTCGLSNGGSFVNVPTENLCTALGSSSLVITNETTYDWTCSVGGSFPAWYNNSWLKRKAITVTSSSFLTNYQININTDLYNETGLAGSWHMNEASGTVAADSSGNAKNATVTGTTVVAGKFGNARSFAASSSDTMLISPTISLASTDYTIETWFQYPLASSATWNTLTRGAGGDHQVIVQRSTMELGSYSTAVSGFYGSGFIMSTLSSGWHHLVAVGSGSTTAFYIDGEYKGSSAFKSITDIYSIGNYQSGTQPFGTIDDTRIYTRALTSTEIASHYNNEAKLDYEDIRFTSSDGVTALNYWKEKDGTFWVKVPSIVNGSNTIYMYYGNASATTTSNGDNVFVFFDDFESDSVGSAPSKWDAITQGTDTTIKVSSDAAYAGSKSLKFYKNDTTTTTAHKTLTLPTKSVVEFKVRSEQTNVTFEYVHLRNTSNVITARSYLGSDASIKYHDGSAWVATGKTYSASQWFDVKFTVKNDEYKYDYALPSFSYIGSGLSYLSNSLTDMILFPLYNNGTYTYYIDSIIVYQGSSSEPVISSGGEETNPGVITTNCSADKSTGGPLPITLQSPTQINSDDSCWYCTHYYTNENDAATLTTGKSGQLDFEFIYSDANSEATLQSYQFSIGTSALQSGATYTTSWIPASGAVGTVITVANAVNVKNSPTLSSDIAYGSTYHWWIKVKNNNSIESGWVEGAAFATPSKHWPIVRIAADKTAVTIGSDIQYCATTNTLNRGTDTSNCFDVCWLGSGDTASLTSDDWKCSVCYNSSNQPVLCGESNSNAFTWAMPTDSTFQSSTNIYSANPVLRYTSPGDNLKPRLKITGSDCSGEGEGTTSNLSVPRWIEIGP